MSKLEKLPYHCKELVNMFALKNMNDFPAIEQFNEIADYTPCIYSNEKVIASESKYLNWKKKMEKKQHKLLVDYEQLGRKDINQFYGQLYYEFNLYLCDKYHDKTEGEIYDDYHSDYLGKKWKWDLNCLNGKKQRNYNKYFRELQQEEQNQRIKLNSDEIFSFPCIFKKYSRLARIYVTEKQYYLPGRVTLEKARIILLQLGINITDSLLLEIFGKEHRDDIKVNKTGQQYPCVIFTCDTC